METDLNKIIKRQDYVKLTKALREKCDYVEGVIGGKMEELELRHIAVNGVEIVNILGHLFVRTPEYECEGSRYKKYYTQISLAEKDEESFTEPGTDNCIVFYPCSDKHALNFLNNAAAIIQELGKIEQEKVGTIEQAIEAAKDL